MQPLLTATAALVGMFMATLPGIARADTDAPPASTTPAAAVTPEAGAITPPPSPSEGVIDAQTRYVLGAELLSAPAYSGGGGHQLKVHPMWALRWGRWRISTGRAGGLLGPVDTGSGASTDLLASERWTLTASLRIDAGRSSSDDPALAGLPDGKRTVRLRVAARYALAPPWRLALAASQDLLGRGGGANASADLSYDGRWSPYTTWSAGAGVSLADATYLESRFGVPASAARAGRPAFQPSAGWQDMHAGFGVTTRLDYRWVMFGSIGASRLLQSAAASPLTKQPGSATASIGVAWRGGP